jgi:hypothetical protein
MFGEAKCGFDVQSLYDDGFVLQWLAYLSAGTAHNRPVCDVLRSKVTRGFTLGARPVGRCKRRYLLKCI